MLASVFFCLTVLGVSLGQYINTDDEVVTFDFTKTPFTQTPVVLTCDVQVGEGVEAREINIARLSAKGGYTWMARFNENSGLETNNQSTAFADSNIFDHMKVEGGLTGDDLGIEVTWPTTDEGSIFGKYVCNVVYSKNYLYRVASSPELEVGESGEVMDRVQELLAQGEVLEATQVELANLQADAEATVAQVGELVGEILEALSGLQDTSAIDEANDIPPPPDAADGQ